MTNKRKGWKNSLVGILLGISLITGCDDKEEISSVEKVQSNQSSLESFLLSDPFVKSMLFQGYTLGPNSTDTLEEADIILVGESHGISQNNFARAIGDLPERFKEKLLYEQPRGPCTPTTWKRKIDEFDELRKKGTPNKDITSLEERLKKTHEDYLKSISQEGQEIRIDPTELFSCVGGRYTVPIDISKEEYIIGMRDLVSSLVGKLLLPFNNVKDNHPAVNWYAQNVLKLYPNLDGFYNRDQVLTLGESLDSIQSRNEVNRQRQIIENIIYETNQNKGNGTLLIYGNEHISGFQPSLVDALDQAKIKYVVFYSSDIKPEVRENNGNEGKVDPMKSYLNHFAGLLHTSYLNFPEFQRTYWGDFEGISNFYINKEKEKDLK